MDGGAEDGVVVSPGSPHPESEPLPLGVAIGVDDGVVVPGAVGVGVYVGGTTDPGADGVPDNVGSGTDPGEEGTRLGVFDDVGGELVGEEGTRLGVLDGVAGELVGEEPPEVVVAFPVTSCAASAQNATNKLTY